MSYYQRWIDLKEQERIATDLRRQLEDEMIEQFGISEQLEGTKNFDDNGYQIKIVGRMTRKVDSDKLQELAADNGLSEHLHNLFRWTPEINAKAWQSTDESITKVLEQAVTTKPARPSFTISIKEK